MKAFNLINQDGKNISLKDFKGKWLVLYFYPKDDTPGCTIEANDFTQYLNDFKKINAEIVGVSPDSTESHCKFIDKHNLKIKLLSDPEHIALVKYGAWGEKKLYGRSYMGVIRSTFIINPNGEIVYSWKNVKAKGHAEIVLSKLKELQN